MFLVLSSFVFLGEFHMYFQYKPLSDLIVSALYYNGRTQVFSLFFVITVFFGYMIFVCSYTIFSVKIFGFYGFY